MEIEQRKEYSRVAVSLLETAVMDVLWEAFHREECIGAAEIGRGADIYGDREPLGILNDAITWGVLSKLTQDGRVTRCQLPTGKQGFQLSDKELEKAGYL